MRSIRNLTIILSALGLAACGGGGGSGGETILSTTSVSGVAEGRLIAYLREMATGPWGPPDDMFGGDSEGRLNPWMSPPTVVTETGAHHRELVAKAVDELNDWLPVENRLIMGQPTDSRP